MLPLRDHLPTRRFPYVNYALLLANVLAFLWERTLIGAGYPAQRLIFDWGLVPGRFLHAPGAEAITVLSSMFLHDPTDLMHIAGNMLFLWIFGDNVEDALGHARYFAFYVLAGLGAAAAQVLIDPHSIVPMVGASGAIAGVLAAYGSLYPRSPITVFFLFIFELPAWIVILEFFLFNLWKALGSLGTHHGGVAFFAHLGGFVTGLLLVRLLLRHPAERHERWQGLRRQQRPLSSPPSRRDPWGW